MKKIMMVTALPVAALALSAPAAGAVNGWNCGPGVKAANDWNFSAAAVCFQQLAVVPVGAASLGDAVNHCMYGNMLNHSS